MLSGRPQQLLKRLLPLLAAQAAAGGNRGTHRHARCSGGGGAEGAAAAKRERRKQRRQHNRELRERLAGHSLGWQCSQGRRHTQPATCSKEEEEGPTSDFELFTRVLGRPRSAAEGRKYARVWRHWQAAGGGEGAEAGASASSSGGRWAAGVGGASSSSSSGDGSSGSRGSWQGTAGASAGPCWGQARWTWDDFRQTAGSAENHSSWDYDTWYEPPQWGQQGRSSSSSRREPPGGGGSSGAWGWHSTWQSSSGGAHRAWQHDGTAAGSGVQGHLQALGLGRSWLASRCGKLLRKAYLAGCKAAHPDMHVGTGDAAAAKDRFIRVQAAYDALLELVPSKP